MIEQALSNALEAVIIIAAVALSVVIIVVATGAIIRWILK